VVGDAASWRARAEWCETRLGEVVAANAALSEGLLSEGLLIFRTANPLGFLSGREGVCVEESSVVYS
jgi:hypothetical protein